MKHFLLVFVSFFLTLSLTAQMPANGLDVQHYRFELLLSDNDNTIKGEAEITVQFTKPVEKVSFDLVQKQPTGKGMNVTAVKKNDRPVSFIQDAQHLIINDAANVTDKNTYHISYEGIPVNGLIIDANKYGHRVFFGDNWPNRARHWLPCNDHLSDKASLEFIITAPEHYQVISNGIRVEETNLPNHLKRTVYKEDVLLPTKEMTIGVADFAVSTAGFVGCIPVYSWIYPEDSEKGFRGYAAAVKILPWFIAHIGNYPYQKLANVQSKTIFGGAENAGAIFYNENSINDEKLEGLLVHEISHQWFGNSVSEKDWNQLWLSEGFATYMTHLYHEEKYGLDSLNNRLRNDRIKVIDFSLKRFTPVSDTSASANLMELLNANSYEKGGWVLHMLRRKIDDSLFWNGIQTYYKVYAGSNATTEDFEKIIEKVYGQNLKTFFKQWFYTPGQPQLNIEWSYNNSNKTVKIKVEQLQNNLFEFPLEIGLLDKNKSSVKRINIKNKVTVQEFSVGSRPDKIEVDPNVNLLFAGEAHEFK